MMKREFQIGKDAEMPLFTGTILQLYIPELDRILRGNKQGLGSGDTPVFASVGTVRKTMAAGICRFPQGFSHGLPGKGPIIRNPAGLIIPDIHIMARPIHGHPIGPEPGDPVVFRRFIKQVPPGGMVKNPAHIPDADVVGPGNRHVHPVNNVFPAFFVKITVFHINSPKRLSKPGRLKKRKNLTIILI
jgi:hypothetical protein